MTDTFFDLAAADRQEVLEIAASASGRPVHLLEKDIWVVWCLETLFGSDIGAPLVFKGGTSLSKAYQVIKRFSEDVDLTYDIRELAPDLVADAPDTLPSSRSQESRWSKEARKRLCRWVSDAAAPFLAEAHARVEPSGDIRVENDEIFIRYAARTPTSDYVRPEVKLEFGARATGEPNQLMPVVCDTGLDEGRFLGHQAFCITLPAHALSCISPYPQPKMWPVATFSREDLKHARPLNLPENAAAGRVSRTFSGAPLPSGQLPDARAEKNEAEIENARLPGALQRTLLRQHPAHPSEPR